MSTPHLVRSGECVGLPVFGVTVEILLDGSKSAGESGAYRVVAPPGTGAPPHLHAGQDEMFHVLAGAFDFLLGTAIQRLETGDFVFVPRGMVHAFTCVGTATGKLLVVGTPAGHEAFFRDCAAAVAAGTFTPETGQEICLRHGIELVQ